MARYIRKTIILAKTEATYGTDAAPTGGANAILVSEATINPLQATNLPRDLIRGYFGGSPQLVGTANVEVGFTVELAGGGGAATVAPAWGPLLQACGFSGAATAGAYEFVPTSTFGANSSVTIYYHLDGQLHKLLGARGTFTLDMAAGARPVMKFRFLGKDGGLTAVADPTPTLTGFTTPVAVTDANTGDILLGCIYTAATGLLSAGTAYSSKGLQLDLGNTLTFQALLGSESVELTQRDVTGNVSLDLIAADAVSFMTAVKANTLTTLGITLGTAVGNTVVIYGPSVQRIEPSVEDLNGQALHAYKLRFVPSAGNDELRIVTR